MDGEKKRYKNIREIMKVYFPELHKNTLPENEKDDKINEITKKLARRFEENFLREKQ